MLADEEDTNRTAYVFNANGSARWVEDGRTTRLWVSSAYTTYPDSDRRDRWSNELGLSQGIRLNNKLGLTVSASAGHDYSTLEFDRADQFMARSEIAYQHDRRHRYSAALGYRHRDYENAARNSGQAPFIDAAYRYRPSNKHLFDVSTRLEWVEADSANYEYARQRLSGYYTHAPDRNNRFRFGLVGQNWEYDHRRTRDRSEHLHRWRVQPELRYSRLLPNRLTLDVDYRQDFSRSNDPAREENGNRVSLSLSQAF